MAKTRWKEGTVEMDNGRESNPKLLGTRLAVLSTILTLSSAGLMSTACGSFPVQAADASVMWGSFAATGNCGGPTRKSPALSASGVAAQAAYSPASSSQETEL